MLKMKLLTLACALGILACGACFLPPSQRNSNPSLPPTQIDLKGIRTIGVRVTNNSEWRHIDASALAHAIEVGINGYTKETGAKASALTATGQEDATIEIAIQSENAILEAKPAPPGTSRWSYKVNFRHAHEARWNRSLAGDEFALSLSSRERGESCRCVE